MKFTARNTTVVWPGMVFLNKLSCTCTLVGIPPDGTPIKVTNTIQIFLVIIFDVLAVVGIIFALICLVFNIVFKNKK